MTPKTKFVFQKFNTEIEKGEIVLDEFSAAVKRKKIQVQGRFFVSNRAMYFYSIVNESKLLFFGKTTKIKVKFCDVESVKKSQNLNFDNSIEIIQKCGSSLFLTSFINRD